MRVSRYTAGVKDAESVAFLQWALPRLHMRWPGFRKVRRQVRRRLARRVAQLGLTGADAYRRYVEEHAGEWEVLDRMCRISISRFGRDQGVWRALVTDVLPEAAERARRDARAVAVWSAGCCGGEEPYSVAIGWALEVAPSYPDVSLSVLATDVDERQLERARRGCYAAATLRELPGEWREHAFECAGHEYQLRDPFRAPVRFALHDVRDPPPASGFDVVLCRNLVFTYYDIERQRAVAQQLRPALIPGGVLVIGSHETLPAELPGWAPRGRSMFARL